MLSNERLENGTAVLIDFSKLMKINQETIVLGKKNVIPAVVQDADSKEVLMLAYANREAVNYSLLNKVAAFWSTSRNRLWVKGASSGNMLKLVEIRVNCEQNSLLYLVKPVNGCGACHVDDEKGESRQSCFYRVLADDWSGLSFVNRKPKA